MFVQTLGNLSTKKARFFELHVRFNFIKVMQNSSRLTNVSRLGNCELLTPTLLIWSSQAARHSCWTISPVLFTSTCKCNRNVLASHPARKKFTYWILLIRRNNLNFDSVMRISNFYLSIFHDLEVQFWIKISIFGTKIPKFRQNWSFVLKSTEVLRFRFVWLYFC